MENDGEVYGAKSNQTPLRTPYFLLTDKWSETNYTFSLLFPPFKPYD